MTAFLRRRIRLTGSRLGHYQRLEEQVWARYAKGKPKPGRARWPIAVCT